MILKSGKELLNNFLKGNKHKRVIVVIFIIGIIFLMIGNVLPFEEKKADNNTPLYDDTEMKLEKALAEIRGVGKAFVTVTYDTSSKNIVATDIDKSGDRYSEKTVTVSSSGSQGPIILSEETPKIRGVLVICEGGDNATVRKNIISAVQALTGVSTHNIGVFAKK